MNERVGTRVVEVLERAGSRYLEPVASDTFQVFLHHIGATASFRIYEGRRIYWQRLQIVLDAFFTASERAEICEELITAIDFLSRREAYDFFAEALAERRLREMCGTLIEA